MSCFLISRQEFAKAGAVLGAFTEIQNSYKEPVLYRYNFEAKRMYNSDDVIKEILSLYDINLKSICDSWEEDESYFQDSWGLAYDEILQYKNYIKSLNLKRHSDIKYRNKLVNILFGVHKFFNSVSYQIDDLALNKEANKIINQYNSYILEIISYLDHINVDTDVDSWGNFDIYFD